jgi:hypothetical protein
MHVLRPLAVLLPLVFLPAVAAQSAPAKPPAPPPPAQGGKDTPPADSGKGAAKKPTDAEPDEKTLIHEFDKDFVNKDATVRVAALMKLGDASRKLPDLGHSRYTAKTLTKGLDDDDLEVQSAAVGQLAWGRDVDTAIDALGKHVENVRKEIDKRITRPDQESKNYVNRATRLFGDTCRAQANYRDDRSVDVLASIIGRLRPNTDGNDGSTRLVGRIAEALTDLGTQDAIDACIKQTGVYGETDSFNEPAAKELHRVLSLFASKAGKAPPDYTATYYVEWGKWFEKNKEAFPKKLGKLKEPPNAPPADVMSQGGKDEGKPPPR